MINGYFNRFNPSKEYESHLFRAGYVLQSAEVNEIQSAAFSRIAGIGDALFKDGDVVRDARVIVNSDTGEVTCESGAIYLSGAVRGVQPGTLTIPTVGIVVVGIYLQSSVVTELEDPELRDPASLTRNYMEPGAARHKLHAQWGFSGDGQAGEFYPVYTVEDGQLRSKEPPPNLDSVTQAIARYDRDSTAGSYVVSGLRLTKLDDLPTGEQVYNLAEGRARVSGYGVDLPTSRRLVYDAVPDLRFINSEPKASTTAGAQRINTDRSPVANITQVQITSEKTVTLTHGGFTGASDPLPDSAVLEIVEVKQGGTTYVANTDYKLTAGAVDWSLAGNEPATGSTYTVKYRYINTVTPTAVDETGYTVTGAVPGTLVLTSYNYKVRRVDRLAMARDGEIFWLQGVASDFNAQPPSVPDNLLSVALIYQTWTDDRYVVNDSVRVVPMSELSAINSRIDFVIGLVAQQRLESDINLREAGQKKGLFVDPFLDDQLRDQGVAQSGAVVNGELTLAVDADVIQLGGSLTAPATGVYSSTALLQQVMRTGSMLVNPYMAFDPIPAQVNLTPAVDRWTEVETLWASPTTQRLVVGSGDMSSTSSNTVTATIDVTRTAIEYLRQIEVQFRLVGFGPGEAVSSVTFDGVAVTPVPV